MAFSLYLLYRLLAFYSCQGSGRGTEQLAAFRSEVMSAFTDISVATSHHTRVIEQLRQIVVTALQGNQVPIQSLRDIVDLMRKNETSFPHFRTSNTYKLFEPPMFENKKKANGYWL